MVVVVVVLVGSQVRFLFPGGRLSSEPSEWGGRDGWTSEQRCCWSRGETQRG